MRFKEVSPGHWMPVEFDEGAGIPPLAELPHEIEKSENAARREQETAARKGRKPKNE